MKKGKCMSITTIKPVKEKEAKGVKLEQISVHPVGPKFKKLKDLLGLKSKKK